MSCKYGFYTCQFKRQPEMCAICEDGSNYQEQQNKNTMRKQHARLNCIMELIQRCDSMIRLDFEICQEHTPSIYNKYSAIRTRLYQAYANQLAKMAQQVIIHTLKHEARA